MNPKTPKLPALFDAATPAGRADAVRTLLIVCAVVIGLNFVPYAHYLTYPLRLLVTFIHEGSHALVALLTGGHVQSIAIQPDGSGVTNTLGGFNPFISSAGYMGATLFGALVVGLLRRGVSGRLLLLVTGACVGLVSLGVLGGIAAFSFNGFGLFWGILLTAALVAGGLKLPAAWASWAAAFVGAECILNALFDLKTLFALSVTLGGPQTDAQNMARMTLIPAPFWAVLWLGAALFMLWAVVLRPQKQNPASVAWNR